MTYSAAFAASSFLLLSACFGSAGNSNALSGFRDPDSAGRIRGEITDEWSSYGSVTTREGRYLVATGRLKDGRYTAFSNVEPRRNITPMPDTGTAQMIGIYRVSGYQNITNDAGVRSATGIDGPSNLRITLTADFGADTLSGVSRNGRLEVHGVLEGRNGLDGSVTYRGVAGKLTGAVSDAGVVGAFHGATPETVFAGGILANSR